MDSDTRKELDEVITELKKPRIVLNPDPTLAKEGTTLISVPNDIRNGSDDKFILWMIQNRLGEDMTLEKYIEHVMSNKRRKIE